MPSSAANGIASACLPSKPTTSQGSDHPLPSTVSRAPTHGVDRLCDLQHKPVRADHATIDFDAVEFDDLFGQRFPAAFS
jgi:hypothetical protein